MRFFMSMMARMTAPSCSCEIFDSKTLAWVLSIWRAIISGPWQMGKVDQGFVVLWLARHLFGGPLSYMGFGGDGLQVRDVLHVDDLYDLIVRQLSGLDEFSGGLFNVGGGMANSLSLRELTSKSQKLSGRKIEIGRTAETRDADIPFYVS